MEIYLYCHFIKYFDKIKSIIYFSVNKIALVTMHSRTLIEHSSLTVYLKFKNCFVKIESHHTVSFEEKYCQAYQN